MDTTTHYSTDPTEPLDFYGGLFSNFAISPISVDLGFGTATYRTVEHAFQAAKATKASDQIRVRSAFDPWDAKKIGRRITLRSDWEAVKYEIMLQLLRAKFEIERFRSALLETGDRLIREDSPTDFEWGYRNNGKNLLGKALMQIRDELRAAEEVREAS